MPKLVFTDSKFAGREYKFAREKTAIGRTDDNLLVIRDTSVSSHHCEIIVNGGEVIVRDLDSRNGTYVNGQRLKNQQTGVKSGGTIRFGTVQARVEIEPAKLRDDATEITAVYSHQQLMNQARQSKDTPAPDPAMRLDAPEAPGDEPTILMPTSREPVSSSAGTEPQLAVAPPRREGRGPWLLILAAVAVAAVLVWLIWLR